MSRYPYPPEASSYVSVSELDFNRLKRKAARLRELEQQLKEAEDFVRYVDATAPELRTAYQVSKRIE